MKRYNAVVKFRDIDTNEVYGTEVYKISASDRKRATTEALKQSESSNYFDARISFAREVVLTFHSLAVGDTFIMPEPNPALNDAWKHGNFEAKVIGFRKKGSLVTVQDLDNDAFDIEFDRAIALFTEQQ